MVLIKVVFFRPSAEQLLLDYSLIMATIDPYYTLTVFIVLADDLFKPCLVYSSAFSLLISSRVAFITLAVVYSDFKHFVHLTSDKNCIIVIFEKDMLAHTQDEVSGKLCFFSFLFFFSPTSQDHHILMSFIYTKLGKTTPKWKKEREQAELSKKAVLEFS